MCHKCFLIFCHQFKTVSTKLLKRNVLFAADTKAEIRMKMGTETHKGKEYYKNEKTQVKLTVNKVKVHFGNLFDGDQRVSK